MAFQSPQTMLEWQYQQVLSDLGHLQRHAADPNCPCNLADIGEYCLAKHSLDLVAVVSETIAMVPEPERETLETLQSEAQDWHEKIKTEMCHPPVDRDALMSWARQWRKKLEPAYYACSAKRSVRHAEATRSEVASLCTQSSEVEQASQAQGQSLCRLFSPNQVAHAERTARPDPYGSRCRSWNGAFRPTDACGSSQSVCKFGVCYNVVKTGKAMHSENEVGAPICSRNGKLFLGQTVQGEPHSVNVPLDCGGAQVVGTVHSHPGGDPNPSSQDEAEARRLGLQVLCIKTVQGVVCKAIR